MNCISLHNKGRLQNFKTILLACLAALCVAVIADFSMKREPQVKPQLPVTSSDSKIVYSAPIVITKGGTYTGNWESKDTEIPAVEVKTSEPVTIIRSNIRGAGYLIKSWGYGANLTIKHTNGYGITPTPWKDYHKPRRFLALDVFKNLVVEHCYLENTAGIYLGVEYVGNYTTENTIKIRFNKVKNVDGRIYDGKYNVQFVQFNFRRNIKYAEIAWNEVINEPENSAVEDNINIYNSRGTPDSPILIYNNFIKGGYPVPASEKKYTGGGIMVDSPAKDTTAVSAYVKIYDNQLVGLGNHCIAVASGNHIEICNNRAIVAAQFDDGSPYSFWTSGIWANDYYKNSAFYKINIHHNTIAVTGQTGTWRNDLTEKTTSITNSFENMILPGQVTKEMEEQEYLIWQQKLELANIKLGPQLQATRKAKF